MSKARSAAIERLKHMTEAAEALGAYVARGRDAYDQDPAIRDAILYQVLGEAGKAALIADPSLEESYPTSNGRRSPGCETPTSFGPPQRWRCQNSSEPWPARSPD